MAVRVFSVRIADCEDELRQVMDNGLVVVVFLVLGFVVEREWGEMRLGLGVLRGWKRGEDKWRILGAAAIFLFLFMLLQCSMRSHFMRVGVLLTRCFLTEIYCICIHKKIMISKNVKVNILREKGGNC